MSPRTRWLVVPAVALLALDGCHSPCCKRPNNSCPQPAPPGTSFVAPAPGGYGGPPAPAGGNVLMPAPLPPSGSPPVPAAPPPTFPSGTPSYYPPVASNYPPEAKSEVQKPKSETPEPPVRLLPPETATKQPAAGLSESASTPATAGTVPPLPVGIQDFIPVMSDRVANGRKPTLDGLDWLKANGYKSVLFVHRLDVSDVADRKQLEQRGLKFMSLEVEPATLSWATVEAFARAVDDSAGQPLFIYDSDGSLTGGLWYLYFRRIERLPDEAAKLRASRLGWRENPSAAASREMAEAVRRMGS